TNERPPGCGGPDEDLPFARHCRAAAMSARRAAAAWTSSCGLLGTAERTGWRAIASVATGPPGFLAFLAPTPTLPRKRRREQKLAAQPAARPRLDPSPQAEE